MGTCLLFVSTLFLIISPSVADEAGHVKTLTKTSRYVLHMEIDINDATQMIFSDKSAIRRIPLPESGSPTGEFINDTVLVGHDKDTGYAEGIGMAARFEQIASFEQINSTHMILADQLNKCIRMVDQDAKTDTFAGKCQQAGLKYSGTLKEARFIGPWTIKSCGSNFFLTDHPQEVLMKLDPINDIVTQVASDSRMNFPRGIMFLNQQCSSAYVTFNHGIMRVDTDHGHTELLTSPMTGSGFLDGLLTKSRIKNPVELVQIGSDRKSFVVVDNGNNRIRLVAGENKDDYKAISVCTGHTGWRDGPYNECNLFMPWSLTYNNDTDTLYIGEYRAIRYITRFSVLAEKLKLESAKDVIG